MTIQVHDELNMANQAFLLALHAQHDQLADMLVAKELSIGIRTPTREEIRGLCVLRAAFRYHVVGIILQEA